MPSLLCQVCQMVTWPPGTDLFGVLIRTSDNKSLLQEAAVHATKQAKMKLQRNQCTCSKWLMQSIPFWQQWMSFRHLQFHFQIHPIFPGLFQNFLIASLQQVGKTLPFFCVCFYKLPFFSGSQRRQRVQSKHFGLCVFIFSCLLSDIVKQI